MYRLPGVQLVSTHRGKRRKKILASSFRPRQGRQTPPHLSCAHQTFVGQQQQLRRSLPAAWLLSRAQWKSCDCVGEGLQRRQFIARAAVKRAVHGAVAQGTPSQSLCWRGADGRALAAGFR
jgi:hypothetical protein